MSWTLPLDVPSNLPQGRGFGLRLFSMTAPSCFYSNQADVVVAAVVMYPSRICACEVFLGILQRSTF